MYLIYPNGPHPVQVREPPEGLLAYEYHPPDLLLPVVRIGDRVLPTDPDGVLRRYEDQLAVFYDPRTMTYGLEVYRENIPVHLKVLAQGQEAHPQSPSNLPARPVKRELKHGAALRAAPDQEAKGGKHEQGNRTGTTGPIPPLRGPMEGPDPLKRPEEGSRRGLRGCPRRPQPPR